MLKNRRFRSRKWHYIVLGLMSCCLAFLLGSGAIPALLTPSLSLPAVAETSPSLDRGRQLYDAGRFAEAAEVWQTMADRYARGGDRANQVLSLNYLSSAYQKLNQWDLAQQAIDRSLALLQEDPATAAILWAQAFNTQAGLFLHAGQTQTALDAWKQAETYYQQAGDLQGVLGSQLNQARAWHVLGYYQRSRQLLSQIEGQIEDGEDSLLKVSLLHSLGEAFRVSGDGETSNQVLRQGLYLAETLNAKNELSPILLSLGNTASDRHNIPDALYYFEQAEGVATHPEARLEAQLNRLRLYAEFGKISSATALAAHIQQEIAQLPPSRSSIYDAINLASTLDKIENRDILPPQTLARLLADAVRSARSLQDPTAEAYGLNQLGQLYARTGQVEDGIKLLRQSLDIGQTLQTNSIVSQSAWSLGRLLKQTDRKTEAIAAYSEAINALQALREDLVGINQDVQFSFRESVEPVYRQLVGLLLDNNPDQTALKKVRELIESLQLAELDDFFRDACLNSQPRQIDEIDPKAAVLYSIMLPDRLALVVSAAGQPLSYKTIPVSQTQVENTVRDFLSAVHPVSDNAEQLRLSQRLYDWLIRPAEEAGALQGRQTLVFVLDGLLQRLPISALHDGHQYLIEKYAVALSPGLKLMAAQALKQEKIQAVVGGISEARGGFKALPKVEEEVQEISRVVPSIEMLNQTFTRQNLAKQLQGTSVNVVHLATHGQFSSNQENTFLLAWDGRLNVRELSELLKRRETKGSTRVDLLILSACDTAAGDDRAVLGLAGFAVKSGARSTVASLWPVKDRVAAQLMVQFYEALRQPDTTKAEALRQAQRSLLADESFSDPFFWSSFVMVGNWL